MLKEKSRLLVYAEEQFERLKNQSPDAIVLEFKQEILALVDAFDNSGQSGASAPYVSGAIIHTLKNLLGWKPLVGVENNDEDWIDVSENFCQHKHLMGLFKIKDNSKIYYLDGLVVREVSNKTCWNSYAVYNKDSNLIVAKESIVKSFPFTPKTFFVDCKEIDGKWILTEEGEKQFAEAQEYYDFDIIKKE